MANWFLLIQNAFQELQDSKSFLVHHVSRTLSLWKDHRLDILSYTLIIIETRLKSYHIMGLMRENLLIPIYFIIGRMPLSALLPLLMHLACSYIRQILILEKLKCKAPVFSCSLVLISDIVGCLWFFFHSAWFLGVKHEVAPTNSLTNSQVNTVMSDLFNEFGLVELLHQLGSGICQHKLQTEFRKQIFDKLKIWYFHYNFWSAWCFLNLNERF